MRIQQSTIDEIIEKADIVEVVGEYVKLEKKGNDYKGLCPFHNDSNPSLSVSPQKKIYKCFSCNEAGNVVHFVEKIKNINYVEALKYLASKYNVTLDIKENPQFEKYKKGYKILKEASSAYEFYLKNTVEGKDALNYLHNRKLTDEVIKRFEIGLSSKKDNIICKTLLESGKFLPLDLMETKLIDRNKNGSYYDLFNSRIIFPIKDLNGNCVGFSGRIFPDGKPKYINSVDNYIFKKGNILYNYSDAVNQIKLKDCVFLFEGFMDVIAAYRAGLENAVASMGTSLTSFQIKALKKITNNIVVCYDSDDAGVEATKRAIMMLIEEGFNVNCIYMTESKDADEFINEYGEKALLDYFNSKQISSVDYFYLTAKKSLNINDPNSVIKFQRDVYKIISLFKSSAFEAYLISKLSKDLNASIDDLNKELKDYSVNNIKPAENTYIPDYDALDYLPGDLDNESLDNKISIKFNKRKKDKYLTAEKAVLYLAYNSKKDCMYIRNKLGFRSYVERVNRDILYKLYDYYSLSDVMNSQDFFKKLNENELSELSNIINTQNIFANEEIDSLINTIIEFQYEKISDEIKENISLKKHTSVEDVEKLALNKKKLLKIKK